MVPLRNIVRLLQSVADITGEHPRVLRWGYKGKTIETLLRDIDSDGVTVYWSCIPQYILNYTL